MIKHANIKCTIMEQNENHISLKTYLANDYLYFNGHFPHKAIWAGVAQLKLIKDTIEYLLSYSVKIVEIKRVKFLALVNPNSDILLKISKNNNDYIWECYANNKICSKGIINAR